MRSISIALTLVALLLATACQEQPASTTAETARTPTVEETRAAAELTPEELGVLGAQIEKQPNDAEKILSAKGLNEHSFEQAIRKVAEDPEASKRYAESYKRAKA